MLVLSVSRTRQSYSIPFYDCYRPHDRTMPSLGTLTLTTLAAFTLSHFMPCFFYVFSKSMNVVGSHELRVIAINGGLFKEVPLVNPCLFLFVEYRKGNNNQTNNTRPISVPMLV